MSTSERRVQTLRIAAPSRQLARRGQILLEDALRTASLDGPRGRLRVVRRLDCGPLRPDRSPASVSLEIERRLREMSAVYADEPAAARAHAVYFHDHAEPARLLALRLAEGHPADAWFWPLALPGWRPDTPAAAGLRLALRAALAGPSGPLAAARLVAALHARGRAAPLLAALAPADGPALLQACGWEIGPVQAHPPERRDALPPTQAPPPIRPAAPAGWAALLDTWSRRWGQGDARARWLAAVALVDERPARLLAPDLPARAAAILAGPAPAPAPPRAAVLRAGGRPPSESPEAPGQAPEPPDRPGAPPIAPGLHGAAGDTAPAEPPPLSQGAGLFLLLPALSRLGIAAQLAEHPWLIEADLPRAILRAAARRVGLPPSDPALLALGAPPPDSPAGTWEAPARWADGLGLRGPLRVRRPPPGAPAIERVAATFIAAARRWCRLYAGIGLHSLIRRPGRVAATPTHLDVFFPLDQSDPRIRRAGLDLDPGWLPWLGHIVLIHYG